MLKMFAATAALLSASAGAAYADPAEPPAHKAAAGVLHGMGGDAAASDLAGVDLPEWDQQARPQRPGAGGAPETDKGDVPNKGDKDDDFFSKLNWGAGLGYVLDFEGKERIGDADVVNGIVRIKDENDASVSLLLEAHYFFHPRYDSQQLDIKAGDWGVGPFVAAQVGNEDLIETVALGVMMGWRRKAVANSGNSFNIGVGIAVDPDAQVFGDGVEANKPLPVGETAIRYKERRSTA